MLLDKEKKEGLIRIDEYLVDLNLVSYNSLKSMRVYWPISEYLLLKTRKQSRIKRDKTKSKMIDLKARATLQAYGSNDVRVGSRNTN